MPGVHLEVYVQRDARMQGRIAQGLGMLQRDGGLRDGVHGQGGGTGGVRPTEDEDGPRNLRAPQAKRLGKIRHGKRRRALGLQQLRHSRVAMAIGIGLYHGHHGRAAAAACTSRKFSRSASQAHLAQQCFSSSIRFPSRFSTAPKRRRFEKTPAAVRRRLVLL